MFLPLFNTNFISKSFGGPLRNSVARMRGKARDILILERITDFSTTGSAGLKRRNNGRKYYTSLCGQKLELDQMHSQGIHPLLTKPPVRSGAQAGHTPTVNKN